MAGCKLFFHRSPPPCVAVIRAQSRIKIAIFCLFLLPVKFNIFVPLLLSYRNCFPCRSLRANCVILLPCRRFTYSTMLLEMSGP